MYIHTGTCVLSHRIRRQLVTMMSPTKLFSLVSLASSRFFWTSCFSSMITIRWLHFKNAHAPVTSQISYALSLWELRYFSFLTSLKSRVLIRISWPAYYLELLRWVRVVLSFRRKDKEFFSKSSSPLPQTRTPYPWWRVVEISTLIVSFVTLRCNSPGDISPQFLW